MGFLEKDLEDLIFNNSQSVEGRMKLAERGLLISAKTYRQVELSGYGRLDLRSVSMCDNRLLFNIYELKKETVGMKTFLQACRYRQALQNIVINRTKTKRESEYKIVLIGRDVKKDDGFLELYEYIDFVDVIIYDHDDILGTTFYYLERKNTLCESLNTDKYCLPICDLRELITINNVELEF